MKAKIVLLLLVYSSFSFADATLPKQVIDGMQTGWGGEGVYFYFGGGEIVEGCTHSGVIVQEGPMSDKILSMALSAYHTGKPVQFRISGCFGGWMNGIAVSI